MGEYAAINIPNEGVYCSLVYQESNLRIRQANWVNNSLTPIRVRIWDGGLLVHDQNYGPGSGTENIPGNYQLTWEVDPNDGGAELKLPAGIQYQMDWQS